MSLQAQMQFKRHGYEYYCAGPTYGQPGARHPAVLTTGWDCAETMDLDCTEGFELSAAEVQTISTRADHYQEDYEAGALTGIPGSFQIQFRGATSPPVNASASAAELEAALMRMFTIGRVRVSRSQARIAKSGSGAKTPVGDTGYTWSVTFLSEHGDVPFLVPSNVSFPSANWAGCVGKPTKPGWWVQGCEVPTGANGANGQVWVREATKGREVGPHWQPVARYDPASAKANGEWYRRVVTVPVLANFSAPLDDAAAIASSNARLNATAYWAAQNASQAYTFAANGTAAAAAAKAWVKSGGAVLSYGWVAPLENLRAADSTGAFNGPPFDNAGRGTAYVASPSSEHLGEGDARRAARDSAAAMAQQAAAAAARNLSQNPNAGKAFVRLTNPAFAARDLWYSDSPHGKLNPSAVFQREQECARALNGSLATLFTSFDQRFHECKHTVATGRLDLVDLQRQTHWFGNHSVDFWSKAVPDPTDPERGHPVNNNPTESFWSSPSTRQRDQKARYTEGGTQYVVPEGLPIEIGDRVFALYKGLGTKHFPGTVRAVNTHDNTYSVEFDDGNKDGGVPLASIRGEGGRTLHENGTQVGGVPLGGDVDGMESAGRVFRPFLWGGFLGGIPAGNDQFFINGAPMVSLWSKDWLMNVQYDRQPTVGIQRLDPMVFHMGKETITYSNDDEFMGTENLTTKVTIRTNRYCLTPASWARTLASLPSVAAGTQPYAPLGMHSMRPATRSDVFVGPPHHLLNNLMGGHEYEYADGIKRERNLGVRSYQSCVDVEPVTGRMVRGYVRAQWSFKLQPDSLFPQMSSVYGLFTPSYIPYFWRQQGMQLHPVDVEALANDVRARSPPPSPCPPREDATVYTRPNRREAVCPARVSLCCSLSPHPPPAAAMLTPHPMFFASLPNASTAPAGPRAVQRGVRSRLQRAESGRCAGGCGRLPRLPHARPLATQEAGEAEDGLNAEMDVMTAEMRFSVPLRDARARWSGCLLPGYDVLHDEWRKLYYCASNSQTCPICPRPPPCFPRARPCPGPSPCPPALPPPPPPPLRAAATSHSHSCLTTCYGCSSNICEIAPDSRSSVYTSARISVSATTTPGPKNPAPAPAPGPGVGTPAAPPRSTPTCVAALPASLWRLACGGTSASSFAVQAASPVLPAPAGAGCAAGAGADMAPAAALQSLHPYLNLPCVQIWLPPQSLQRSFRRLCSQIPLPPQSLHRFR
jgi:hypothetical protein